MAHPNWRPLLEGFDAGVTGINVEYRHPLLDLRVIACAMSLPAIPWCVDKHILRAAGQNMLPKDILTRPKAPLRCDPVPFAIRDYVAQSSEPFALHPLMSNYVNSTHIQELIDDMGSDAYSSALRVLVMNEWLSNQ
jgi:hypothetical protein